MLEEHVKSALVRNWRTTLVGVVLLVIGCASLYLHHPEVALYALPTAVGFLLARDGHRTPPAAPGSVAV